MPVPPVRSPLNGGCANLDSPAQWPVWTVMDEHRSRLQLPVRRTVETDDVVAVMTVQTVVGMSQHGGPVPFEQVTVIVASSHQRRRLARFRGFLSQSDDALPD